MSTLIALFLFLDAGQNEIPIQPNLIMIPAIQKELEIIPEQVIEIRRSTDLKKLTELKKVSSNPKLSLEDRTQLLQKINKELMDDLESTIREVLRPHQLERLRQLSLQAISRRNQLEALDKAGLRLTEQQKEKLVEIKTERALELKELISRHNDETERLLLKTLSKQQYSKWQKAVGPKLEVDGHEH